MSDTTAPRELMVRRGDVELAGSLWLPTRPPLATVLMHPGSGPSDRHNDVYFPPIRDHLLRHGCAVSSFDKRGVGRSTGRLEDAGIVEQADDVLAVVDALLALPECGPAVGLFGHSQGGWVVVDAASRSPRPAFVVTNSGPALSPAEQERYAIRAGMTAGGFSAEEIEDTIRRFDAAAELMRSGVPFEAARRRLAETGSAISADLERFVFVPADAAEWRLAASMIDYDPRPALARLRVPLMALFGGGDHVVPVEASVAVLEEVVAPERLRIAVLPGGNHRIQTGDPARPVDGYLPTLTALIAAALR